MSRRRAGLTWDGNPKVKPAFGAAAINWAHPIARDAMAWWDMVEGGGTTLTDLTGRYTGTIVGATWSVGGGGYALTFSGVTQYVTMGSVLDFGTGDFSVAAVAAGPASGSSRGIVGEANWGAGNQQWWVRDQAAGTWRFQTEDAAGGTGVNTASTIAANTAYRVVVTRVGTTVSIYLNGRLDNSASGTVRNVSSAQAFVVGIGPAPSYWSGTIDQVRAWSRGLTADEILALYAEPYVMLSPRVRRSYFVPPTPAGVVVPVMDHHYRLLRAS